MIKQEIYKEIRQLEPLFQDCARTLFEHPETGGNEKFSANYLREILEKEGFTIHNVEKMEHAFYAEYGQGKPVIAILGEYDALPGLSQKVLSSKEAIVEGGPGHGCGHNLLGSAALIGAIAVKRFLEKNKVEGTVRFYGCPEEELLKGKVKMLRLGMFEGCDLALSWHPMDVNCSYEESYLANVSVRFAFHGKTAHAAVAPWQGRSALDAVELMNVGVNYLREHVIDSARIHYSTDSGNVPPNIVPDYASSWYFIRAPHMADVLSILERVQKVAKGAAMMTETKVDIDVEYGCWEMKKSKTMADVCYDNLKEAPAPQFSQEELSFAKEIQKTLDRQTVLNKDRLYGTKKRVMHPIVGDRSFWKDAFMTASTDTGDVSYNMPMSTFSCACWPIGVVPHTWQASACAGSSLGQKGAFYAAHVFAGQAFDFITHPEYVKMAQKEFRENKSVKYKSILNHFE